MPKNIYNQGFVKNLLEVMVPPSSREVSGFTEARTSHHLPPSLTFSHNLPQSPRPERDFLVAELLDRLPVDAKVESVGTVLERLPSWKRAAFYSGRLEEVLAHSRAADVRRAMLGGFETMLSEEQEYAPCLT